MDMEQLKIGDHNEKLRKSSYKLFNSMQIRLETWDFAKTLYLLQPLTCVKNVTSRLEANTRAVV